MPRNGKLVRITLALAAAALVAALGGGHGRRGVREEQQRHASTAPAARSSRRSCTQWVGPVGSACGISSTTAASAPAAASPPSPTRTVDFGASDAPLTPTVQPTCNGCVQIPWALAATARHLQPARRQEPLHMTGSVLAKIYLGKITKLERPGDQEAQQGRRTCPSTKITVVHRSDGSGTTYNFTDYLSHVSASLEVAGRHGHRRQLAGRHGRAAAAPASPAPSGTTPGAIGYVDVVLRRPQPPRTSWR